MGNYKGSKYDGYLSSTEICKLIRAELKETFPKCKFSVSKQDFAGGRSIDICLMSAPFNPFLDHETQTYYEGYKVNQYHIDKDKRLTFEARLVFIKMNSIVMSYNYDDSDIQSDYFDTNFYYSLMVGKYNNPFEEK